MRNDDANQAMMMGAGAAVTMTSCASNAVDSSLDLATVVCEGSNSGFGAIFGLLVFIVGPLAGWIAWDFGLAVEFAGLVGMAASVVWIYLWSRFFAWDSNRSIG